MTGILLAIAPGIPFAFLLAGIGITYHRDGPFIDYTQEDQ